MRDAICRSSPEPETFSVFVASSAATTIARSARIANGPTRSSSTVVYRFIGSTSLRSRTTVSHDATFGKSRMVDQAVLGDAATRTVRATSWNMTRREYPIRSEVDTNSAYDGGLPPLLME